MCLYFASLNPTTAAKDVDYNHPMLIVKQSPTDEVFLIVEKQVLCKIPATKSAWYLLAAYYAFNFQRG